MFSDITGSYVVTEIRVETTDGTNMLLRIPQRTATQNEHAVIPTPKNMKRRAHQLAKVRWQQCGDIAHSYSKGGVPLHVVGVRMTHLVIDFEATSGAHRTKESTVYDFSLPIEV